MPNRSLSYKVEFDTRSAVRDLQRLTREGKRAGEEIADGFDKTETAGTNALRALTRQLDTLEQNAEGTARAAAAIGARLGDGFDTAKVSGFVADLNRIGVGFDEIEAKAEEFAAIMRRADDTELSGLRSEIDRVDDGLDRVRNNSDQSRSVLANLAGNSAQSLGELGGVVGDLGVGIGQLVEYSVDGNIALSNLAKVAGPMAGLAAAGVAVAAAMGKVREHAEANRRRLELFTEAARDGTDALDALEDEIRDTGELEFTPTGFLAGAKDLLPILDQLGINWDEFQRLVREPGLIEHLRKLADEAGGLATPLGQLYLSAIEGITDYSGAIDEAAANHQQVMDFLGAPLPLDKIADDFADSAAAAEEFAAQLDDARQAIADIAAEPVDIDLAEVLDAQDFRLDFQVAKAAVDDAFEELQDHVNAHGPIDWSALLDVSQIDPSQLDAEQLNLITGVRDTFQAGIVSAFEMGGSDAAQHFVDTFLPRLAAAGGPTDSQAIYRLLGLDSNGSIDATIQPYIDAAAADQARRILDAIAGTDTADARVAQIQIAIDQGRLEGEIANLAAQIVAADVGLAVYPTVDEDTTQTEIDQAQAWLDANPVDVDVDVAPAERSLRTMVSKVRTAKVDAEPGSTVKTTGENLDDIARNRTSTVDTAPVAQLVQALLVNAFLDHAARPRTVSIGVEVTGLATANQLLDHAARDRTSTITVDAVTWQLQQAIATAISNAVRLGRVLS